MNVHKYDLNLLVIFDMIYQELHLTRAGTRLNMSQPAMSQALKKLRDTFEDPLFVRSGKDLVATELAQQIASQVKQVVSMAEKAFQDRGEFDPATAKRTFRLTMSDYTEMVMMPLLFKRIQNVAPNIKIESSHLSSKDYHSGLEKGDFDIVLSCALYFKANAYRQNLFDDREVVVVRADSPILQEKLTLEKYVSLNHAQFHWMEGDNEIDEELKRMNLERRVLLEVQHEMVLPLVLRNNDLLVNMPLRMAKLFKELLPLEILELPLKPIEYSFSQHWHERNHHDPAHSWLRQEIFQVASSLPSNTELN